MPIFSQTVQAVLAGRSVRRERLVEFRFKTDAIRLWEGGNGRLKTPDNRVWSGSGELGSIGDIEASIGGIAPTVEFSLSGVDPSLVGKALSANEEVKGQPVVVLVQHYDDNWVPLDAPYQTFTGIMDRIMLSNPVGSSTRAVKLIAETIWTRRGFAPFSYISDRDQQRLYPGDRGCEQVASMASKTVQWPQF